MKKLSISIFIISATCLFLVSCDEKKAEQPASETKQETEEVPMEEVGDSSETENNTDETYQGEDNTANETSKLDVEDVDVKEVKDTLESATIRQAENNQILEDAKKAAEDVQQRAEVKTQEMLEKAKENAKQTMDDAKENVENAANDLKTKEKKAADKLKNAKDKLKPKIE